MKNGGLGGGPGGNSGGDCCGGLTEPVKNNHLARFGTQSIFRLDPKNGNLLLSQEWHTQSNFVHAFQTIVQKDMYQTKSTSEFFS